MAIIETDITSYTFNTSVPIDSVGTEALTLTLTNNSNSTETITPYLDGRFFSIDLSTISVAAHSTYVYTIYANPHNFGTNTGSLYFTSRNPISAKVSLSCNGVTATSCLNIDTPDNSNFPITSSILLSTNDSVGVNQSSLNVTINGTQAIQYGAFISGWTGSIIYNSNFIVSISAPSIGWGYNKSLSVIAYIITKDNKKGIASKTFTTHSIGNQVWDSQSDFSNNITANTPIDTTATIVNGALVPALSSTYWRAKYDTVKPKILRKIQIDTTMVSPGTTYSAKVRGASNRASLLSATWSSYLPTTVVGNTIIADVSSLYLLCSTYEIHIEMLRSTNTLTVDDYESPTLAPYTSLFTEDWYTNGISCNTPSISETWEDDLTEPSYNTPSISETWEGDLTEPSYSILIDELWEVGFVGGSVTYSGLVDESWET